jgi:hypothetical protein
MLCGLISQYPIGKIKTGNPGLRRRTLRLSRTRKRERSGRWKVSAATPHALTGSPHGRNRAALP